MRKATKYDKKYLEQIVKNSKSFRSVGENIGVDGKTAKAILARYNISYSHFKHGKIYEDMIGKTYHMLTVVNVKRIKEKDKRAKFVAECICVCGKSKNILASSIKASRTCSCGCDKSRYKKITGKNNKNFKGHEDIRGDFWNKLKKRTKIRNIFFNLEIKYAWNLFLNQDKKCALSDISIKFGRCNHNAETTASLDRIDSSKGYIKGNVQWVHKSINIMKNDLPENIFIGICSRVSDKFKDLDKPDIQLLSENHFVKRGDKKRK